MKRSQFKELVKECLVQIFQQLATKKQSIDQFYDIRTDLHQQYDNPIVRQNVKPKNKVSETDPYKKIERMLNFKI